MSYAPGDRIYAPRVHQKFFVHSTVEGFDCSGLNDLRKRGAFKGVYECQNQTVPDMSRAESRAGTDVGFMLLICGLVVLLLECL
jgi:hypothetical protein